MAFTSSIYIFPISVTFELRKCQIWKWSFPVHDYDFSLSSKNKVFTAESKQIIPEQAALRAACSGIILFAQTFPVEVNRFPAVKWLIFRMLFLSLLQQETAEWQ